MSRQIMRRGLAAIAVSAVAIGGLTGCGRDDEADGTSGAGSTAEDFAEGPYDGTLTVWAMGGEGENLPPFLEEFEAQHPDLDIEVLAVPWGGAADQFRTAIASGTTPDVAMMGQSWMAEMGPAAEPVPSNIDVSHLFDQPVESATVDGVLRGVPWYVDTRVLFYRTDIAAEAGWDSAPETGEEFLQFLRDINEQTDVRNPIRLTVGVAGAFQDFAWSAWSHGAEMTNADQTEWTFDTPEMTEAMNFYRTLFEEGLAPTEVDQTAGSLEAEFVNGQIAAFIGGPWMRGAINALGGEDFEANYATMRIPAFDSSRSLAGGANLVVFDGTQNRDAAWGLVDWLTSTETQVRFFETMGNLPSSELAWQDPALGGDHILQGFGDQLENIVALPQTETWNEIAAEADRQLERIILGASTVEEALAALQSSAESIGMTN